MNVPTNARYPVQRVVLTDGTCARIRPIRPDDAARMQAFATRLSPRTIFMRTNMVRPARLTDAEAAAATRVDYRSSMAMVAVTGTGDAEEIIGVARYAPDGEGLGHAEVGIVVEDAHQRLGLGQHLFACLAAYARAQGATALVANTSINNHAVLSLARAAGLPAEYSELGYGECQITVSLPHARPRAGLLGRPTAGTRRFLLPRLVDALPRLRALVS